jgi:hypothetical protein
MSKLFLNDELRGLIFHIALQQQIIVLINARGHVKTPLETHALSKCNATAYAIFDVLDKPK